MPMLTLKGQRILAIAPHIDDVETGAGGALHAWSADNEVHYLGLSIPPNVDKASFLEEFRNSLEALDISSDRVMRKEYNPRDLASVRVQILDEFYHLKQDLKPDVVLVPNGDDVHQAHQVVFEEARRAFKQATILGYELPWNNFVFNGSVFVRLAAENLEAKKKAVNAFTSQKSRPFLKDGSVYEDLARVRGLQAGCQFAECFQGIRIML
jgi:LmbE family N-acetylglucosaminyl deacetylase